MRCANKWFGEFQVLKAVDLAVRKGAEVREQRTLLMLADAAPDR